MVRGGVQNGRDQLHAVDESRTRAAEEGCRIDDVKVRPLFASPPPCVTGLSDAPKLGDCALNGVPAGHYKDHIRPSGFHGLPRRFMRWGILRPKDIASASQLDHFRDPMACNIERV